MSWSSLVFLGCISLLLAHELDAVYRKEWQLLPVFRSMNDAHAPLGFILLHVPFIFLLLWSAANYDLAVSAAIRWVFSAFAVIHAGLHAFWPRSALYTFDNAMSAVLIYGSGLFGGLYFLLK